ncbi:MAG: YicC/YloC family endoribonuclease [Bacillota bacterium]|nr:YicC/YloC family endoribonuclease [Bacillota bacterium]
MLKSMTGYGRSEELTQARKIVVEIKSVNNRYNDVSIRVPRAYSFIEENIRGEISKYASRGKIDIFVTIEQYSDENKDIIVDKELAKKYIDKLKEMSEELDIPFDVTVGKLARVPEILTIEKAETDREQIWEDVKNIFNEAGRQYVAMREREGERINTVLKERIEYISELVDKIIVKMPEIVNDYRDRLYAKIQEVLEDRNIDENRVLTEVAIFGDKVSTDEETDRLRSHITEFKKMLESHEPIGRRMDFLIQEMNRETNTIGSKCNDITVAKIVVEIKAEIEKIREQIQNIE